MSQTAFRTFVVAGPLLACSIIPSLLFGVLMGQWGSNILWGSVFGAGWCLAAFATFGIFLWPAATLAALYLLSGVLWRNTDSRQRRVVGLALALTLLIDAPAKAVMQIERSVHLPDFSFHMATSW